MANFMWLIAHSTPKNKENLVGMKFDVGIKNKESL